MCSRLDYYLHALAKIRVDKNKNNWTRLTNFCSPYKPILLLSIFDHIETARITKNFIEPSFELTRTFRNYISLLPDLGRKANIAYPFYYLGSSKFWELRPRPEASERNFGAPSIKKLQEFYYGARFKDDLFPLLQMRHSREKLRTSLIQTYFSKEIQENIYGQSIINCASDRYSDSLLGLSERLPEYNNLAQETENKEKVRDQGFRKAIVKLYDHRCALCGIKMLTPEGHTAVDAAHIKPWSESLNDDPTNGMALCKLCHWSFDEGFMSVDKQYNVLVSSIVVQDYNLPGHIMTLSDRPMFRPSESRFWPNQNNFLWHQKERFRKP
jgi:putative restriction endonuclease